VTLDLAPDGPGAGAGVIPFPAVATRPRACDVAILGGGCAGLSLAVRLVGTGLEVVLVEPRRVWETDRTWSGWRMAPHPFEGCVAHRWPRWRVSAGGRSVVRGGRGYAYEAVDAGRFYAQALATIAAAPNVTLLPGTAAEIGGGVDAPRVTLDLEGAAAGQLHARRVVDTRPLPGRPAYGQFFAGVEIEAETDRFDPETCHLMEFAEPRPDGIAFTYTLPTTPRRALVEATVFAERHPGKPALEAACRTAATRAAGGRYRVIRREGGTIPMDPDFADRPDNPRLLPFGLRGGAARPATGYAFARIQARADALAGRLTGEGTRMPEDGPVMRAMDRLFLKVIARDPARGPELFFRLFDRTPPDRIERFLTGSTAPADRLAVALALPIPPFARAALAR
jgi:lycopene beta-cyclase